MMSGAASTISSQPNPAVTASYTNGKVFIWITDFVEVYIFRML